MSWSCTAIGNDLRHIVTAGTTFRYGERSLIGTSRRTLEESDVNIAACVLDGERTSARSPRTRIP